MQPGGTYFYNFRPLSSLAATSGFNRQEVGGTATIWTWASIGEASINFEQTVTMGTKPPKEEGAADSLVMGLAVSLAVTALL